VRAGWAAGLIILVAACGSGAAVASPTPAVSQTPIPQPSTTAVPLDSPTPPSGGITRVDFSCLLPAYTTTGTVTNDFMVKMPNLAITPAGQGNLAYDPQVGRWLPVVRSAISPDGLRYAYTEGWLADPAKAPNVHIVDAASGVDVRMVTMPDAKPYAVVAYSAVGVLLMIRFDGTPPGIWRIDPDTGALAKISNGYYLRSGAAWVGVVDPRDPNPYRSALDGSVQPNRIEWRDAGGKATTWLYRPGRALDWVPFAGPQALFVMGRSVPPDLRTPLFEFWLVTAPGQAVELAHFSGQEQTPYQDIPDGFLGAVADAHGLWIGSPTSLYLLTREGKLLRVLDRSAYPAGTCN
jgi:hypothetical protein